jgi:YD repeat-containing protein
MASLLKRGKVYYAQYYLGGWPQLQAAVAVCICAGLRREELLWLQIEDVDLDAGENGAIEKDVVTERTYDERGHLASKSIPHYADAAPADISYVRYTYDIRGREIERLEDYPGTADDATTTTDYLTPLSVKVTDPMGHAKTTVRDVYDNVVEMIDHTGGGDYHTYYAYDAADRLIVLTDDHGNLTTITYDTLGRKIALDDPDTGLTSYTYDLAGNLLTQTDNKGQVTTLRYDELNRVLTRTYTDPNTPDVAHTYDEPASSNGIGRLTTVQDGSGAAAFAYYHEARAHLSLGRNSPTRRDVEPRGAGRLVGEPFLGGLHHRYRRAA